MTVDNELVNKDSVRTEFRLIADLNETLKILTGLCDGFDDATDIPSTILNSISMVTSEIMRISKNIIK